MYKKYSTTSKQYPDFILFTFTVIQGNSGEEDQIEKVKS